MPWAYNAVSGIVTHIGADKEAAMATESAPTNMIAVVDCATTAHQMRVRLLASPDGMSGWELGIKAGAPSMVCIRKVLFGVEEAPRVEAAHAIPSGEPFTLEAMIRQSLLTVRLIRNGATSVAAELSFDIANDKLLSFKRWGLVSEVNGAQALTVTRCSLVAGSASAREVLVAVCGGRLFCSVDGTSLAEVPGRVGDSDGVVSADEYAGKLYLVGGGLASIFDPATMSITPWSASDHPNVKLPGATSFGTTTAVGVRFHRGRAILWKDGGRELYGSAFDDPLDFQLDAVGAGAEQAFVDPVDDAIVCVETMPNGNLFIGCLASMKMRLGDPLLGAVDTVDILNNVGVSGPNALTHIAGALAVAHTPQGLYLIPAEGLAVNLIGNLLSAQVEDGGVNISNASKYHVSLGRDSDRQQLMLFLTAKSPTDASGGFLYEERAGGYAPGQASVFPHHYPTALQPTAATVWRTVLVMGTRDGHVVVFDKEAVADANGAAVTGVLPLDLQAANAVTGDSIVSGLRAWVSPESGAMTCRVFGGATAELAYSATYRRQLYQGSLGITSHPLLFTVRAPAVVIELVGTGVWEFDAAETDLSFGQTWSRAGWATPLPAGTACQPPVPASSPTGPTPGPGGSGNNTGSAPPGAGPSGVGPAGPGSSWTAEITPVDPEGEA